MLLLYDLVRSSLLLAHVSLHGPLTLLAGDVAAPVVLALAALHNLLCVSVIASATAHEITAVTAIGGLVALPGCKIEPKQLDIKIWEYALNQIMNFKTQGE